MTVDFGYCYLVRTELMVAADTAALGAISPQSPGYQAALQMQVDGPVTTAASDGNKLFRSQGPVVALPFPVDTFVEVTKSGKTIMAAARFSTDVPTAFLSLFGIPTIEVSGQARAVYDAASVYSYADYYLLLDNTPSMGIGATTADMNALIAATANSGDGAGRNCAFACHMVWSNSGVENPDSTYLTARAKGITLRIDVLKQSVLDMIDDAGAIEGSRNLFRFAAYDFGKFALEPGYQIRKLANLTTSLSSFKSAINGVALMTTDHHDYNEDALTSLDTSLTLIGKEIKEDGGSGSSSADPQRIVFLVTDGVSNSIKPKGCTGLYSGSKYRCLEPIDVSYCTVLKQRNIKIAVLYTTYTPVKDHMYTAYIKKFSSRIGPKLKECASENLYAEVGGNEDMAAMMSQLFMTASTSSQLRLSN